LRRHPDPERSRMGKDPCICFVLPVEHAFASASL
jgi:hypothetical protein